MNCNEVNVILNLKAPDELDPPRRQAVERHLASCDECRHAWQVFCELASAPIPDAPPDLYRKITAALPAAEVQAPRPASRRGRLFIGGAMLAAAAVAAGLALRTGDDGSDPVSSEARPTDSETAAATAPPLVTDSAADPAPAAPAAAESGDETAATDSAMGAIALDPLSIAVVLNRDPDAGDDLLATLTACHAALLQQLPTLDGINVIAGSEVAAFADSGLTGFEIAQELGAASVLIVEMTGLMPSCTVRLSDVATGARLFGATRYPDPTQDTAEDWSSFARSIAMSVDQSVLMDESQIARQAYEMVLNTALPDQQRASALSQLLRDSGPDSALFDSAILAAAIQLGTSSENSSARTTAWIALRGVTDPSLMQPLLFSLGYDEVASVRREAAMALYHFADEPDVRAALQQAIEQDPSQEREQPCCILSVREAAERALLSDAELRDSIEQTLTDESLDLDRRIEPLRFSPDGRVMVFPLSAEATEAVFEIGSASEANRGMAWSMLARGPANPEFVPTLLNDLENHSDVMVRSFAASALNRYTDDPDVRAALERAATEDPAERVQAAARALLEQDVP